MEKATTEEIRLVLKYMSKGYKVPKIIYDTVMNTARREIEMNDRVVLVKRDPDTVRGRIQAARVKITEPEGDEMYDYVMEIHPACVGSFGADFDGDSFMGQILMNKYEKSTGQISEIKLCISDLVDSEFFYETNKEQKTSGKIVTRYEVNPEYELSILSINVDSGKSEKKNISEFSVHENIEMFKIKDTKDRFKIFWGSYDHSLIVYDENEEKIRKISPRELIESPDNKYLIKKGDVQNDVSRKREEI